MRLVQKAPRGFAVGLGELEVGEDPEASQDHENDDADEGDDQDRLAVAAVAVGVELRGPKPHAVDALDGPGGGAATVRASRFSRGTSSVSCPRRRP